MTRIEFEIHGLQDHEDGEAVRRSLSGIEGVTMAAVKPQRGRVTLFFDRSTRPRALCAKARSLIESAGYELASVLAPQPPWGRRRWFRRPVCDDRVLLVTECSR